MPLERIVEGTCDGRSIQGLKRAAVRLAANPKKKPEGHILGNYVKLIGIGELLNPKNFQAVGDEDLRDVIKVMQSENLVWPEATKHQLLMRQAVTCLVERRIPELLQILDPWSTKEAWDPFHPRLQALEDRGQALATWRRILWQELLGDLLGGGERRMGQVQELCKLALKRMEMIDFVELDMNAATYVDEGMTVCRALLALSVSDLDTTSEARHLKNSDTAETSSVLKCFLFLVGELFLCPTLHLPPPPPKKRARHIRCMLIAIRVVGVSLLYGRKRTKGPCQCCCLPARRVAPQSSREQDDTQYPFTCCSYD